MKWTVGTKIATGFGLVLAIYVVVGIVSYQSTTELVETSNLRRQTFELRARLNELLTLLIEIENGQRGFVITGDEEFLETHRIAHGKVDETLREIQRLTANNERHQERLALIQPLIRTRLELSLSSIALRRNAGLEAAAEDILRGGGKENMDQIQAVLAEMLEEEEEKLALRIEEAEDNAERTKWTIMLGTLISITLAAVAGTVITRNIAGRLQDLTMVAERITVGELDTKVTSDDRSDEVGTLARAFSRMAASLRQMAGVAERIAAGDLRSNITPQSPNDILGNAFTRMVANLRSQTLELIEGANVLASAATQIVTSTAQLAATASQTAAAVSETTTTVEEVRQTAQMASQKAKNVSETAKKSAEITQSGRRSTEDVATGMARIRQQMETIAAAMVRLSEQSQAIGQVVATVEDLAAQSNLLAVNAAMEAAKAGEHGKGFAVVAQEVKSLAEQSRQATTQVRTSLNDIQKATSAAVIATEQGSKAVESGTNQTETAASAIQALSTSVNESAQAATQIAASSQQQLVGVDQVATAMESIKEASNQNVTSARQLESAAHNLRELGERLKRMVERYKVDEKA